MLGLQEHLAGAARVGGYRVIRRLATGGTCDVLLAKAEGPHGFGRLVVLKLLLSKYSGDEQFARMFAREAAAYARLDHPSIVRLFDFFSLDGQLVMVLEYVDGMTLAKLVSLRRAGNIEIPDVSALYLGSRIFSAIAAAHSARDPETQATAPVIHRDVNPTNVLLPWDGHAKITDFGIAKVAGIQSDTQMGLIKGTYGYMAPEQVKGEVVTVRADVYAGAIVIWELFAKRPALMRDELPEVELLRMMAEPRLASLDALRPDLDRRVRDVMRTALDPDARKRLISAQDMVTVFRAVAPGDDGRIKLAAILERLRAVGVASSGGTGQFTPGGGGGHYKPDGTGVTQAMAERPRLPPPMPPPMVVSPFPTSPTAAPAMAGAAHGAAGALAAGAQLPAMRAQQGSVGTMSAAIEAAVAAAIESMPPTADGGGTVRGLGAASTVPPPPGAHPADVDDRTGSMTRPELASLLEPMLEGELHALPSFGSTSTSPPEQSDSDAPPATEPLAMALRTGNVGGAPPMPRMGNVVVNDPFAHPLENTVALSSSGMPPGHAPHLASSTMPPSPGDLRSGGDGSMRASSPSTVSANPAPLPQATARDATQRVQKKGSSFVVLTLVGVLLGLLIGGGAAVVHYRPALLHGLIPGASGSASATPTASAKPSATPTASAQPVASTESAASGIPSASASAVPSASTAPVSSGGAAPSASAAPVASAPPSATPQASAAPAGSVPSGNTQTAEISTEKAQPHHRIFVDDKVLGETPGVVSVPCGKHTVKLGSAGKPQSVDVACGERIEITDK